ncbi:MAG: transposase, partial [Acidobacteria bacterium]|nr:transposase [Acidobacteriota bacterium]
MIAAQDASFIPKSGQHTPGLGQFYNGCAGRAERGLEISALGVVDLTQKGAYVAAVTQTQATAPKLKKEQAELTRLDQAIAQIQATRPHLPARLRYLAADGWYAKKKYADALGALGLELVTKLRNDANMRFRLTGARTGQRGRPKTYAGKVDWQDLSRFEQVDTVTPDLAPGVTVFTAELYHCSLKRWLRVVILVWYTADGKRHHAILATTDLNYSAA